MSDEDETITPDKIKLLSDHPAFQNKETQPDGEQPTDDPILSSSKKIFERLNPYLENVIKQLNIAFDDYVVPEDFFHKLAEAHTVINRGDIYTNALLLAISKLRPLMIKNSILAGTMSNRS
jgi:hypothetical protein